MLYAVADLVVDHYVEVAADVEEDVDELEASVFSPQRTDDLIEVLGEIGDDLGVVVGLEGEGQREGHLVDGLVGGVGFYCRALRLAQVRHRAVGLLQ